MNNNIQKMTSSITKFWNKNSSRVMVYAGVVTTLIGSFLACKEIIVVDKKLDEVKDNIDEIKSSDMEDDKKTSAISSVKRGAALYVVKKMLLPVSCIFGGTTCTLVGYNIICKKAALYGAALNTLGNAFTNYRAGVIERFGEEVDKELRLGKTETVVETKTDGTTESHQTIDFNNSVGKDIYTFRFDKTSPMWNSHHMDYNLMAVKSVEAWAGCQLRLNGVNLLSRDLEQLGIRPTAVSAVSGWINDTGLDEWQKDRQISFGIDWNDPYKSVYRDPVTNEDYILIDAKVDGYVVEWLDIPKDCMEFKRFTASKNRWLDRSRKKAGITVNNDASKYLQKGI